MRYPRLNELPQSRVMTEVFGGYNHNPKIADGEFYTTTNTSARDYPLLAPRLRRSAGVSTTNPQGMLARDSLVYVDGATVYVNSYPVTGLVLSTAAGMIPKRLYSMGAYILILPDKKWVNASDLTEYGSTDQVNSIAGKITYLPSRADGTDLEGTVYTQASDPGIVEDGSYWIDISSSKAAVLKRYSALSKVWTVIPTEYTRIEAMGIGTGLEVGDGVGLSGIVRGDGTAAQKDDLAKLNGFNTIVFASANYIVITGMVSWVYIQYTTTGTPVVVSRVVPDMDFITEADNRLWGCKYGVVNGVAVNEIYASAQGNFKNWRAYGPGSMDSWAASVGTDGPFTGAITYLGKPLFFKENFLHKVYGSMPSNYQIETVALRGVQEGSGNSLAIVNETLFYKGRTDVMAYDGSLPISVSSALGGELYSNAAACAYKNLYYISMKDSANAWHQFSLDVSKRIWHREDSLHVRQYAQVDDEIHAWLPDTTEFKRLLGTSGTKDPAVTWSVTSGLIGYESPDHKYVGRMDIRLRLDTGSTFALYIRYDSAGEWVLSGSATGGTVVRTIMLPVRPRRCDHYEMKMEGTGEFRIYSIAKIYEQGGDGR